MTFTLRNGLTVELIPLDGRRTTCLRIGVLAGAAHSATPGLAHFLEHLLFRGSERFPSSLDQNMAFEDIGWTANAETSWDAAELFASGPAHEFGRAVEIVADEVRRPLLRDEHVEAERSVVSQEIGRARDDDFFTAYRLALGSFFAGTPWGEPVLGESVDDISADALRAFHAEAYGAGHAVVAIAGAVDPAALELLEEAFVGWEAPGAPDLGSPLSYIGRFVAERRDTEQVNLRHLWTVGAAATPEVRAAARVLGAILGGNMGSRLFREVREQRGLAYAVGGGFWTLKRTLVLSTYATCAPKRAREAQEVILDVVRRLLQEGPTEREFERAMRAVRGDQLLAGDAAFRQAERAVDEFAGKSGPASVDEWTELHEAVSPEAVRTVAERVVTVAPVSAYVGPSPEDLVE